MSDGEGSATDREPGGGAGDETDWPALLALATRELRMPLNAVLGWVQLLRANGLDEARRRAALETIERNARREAQLLDDLLDLARLAAGQVRLALRAVDPAAALAAAIERARPDAEERRVLLERSTDPAAEPVAADADRLQRMLGELLRAAIRAAPEDGVVEVQLGRGDDGVHLGVRARAPALDLGGVGRRLVERLAALHGGRLAVEGGRAVLVLPRAGGLPGAEPSPPRLHGLRVLAVDDEHDAREVLREILAQQGAEVRTSASAAEAIAAVQAWRPDVLVSDIGMPSEDGYRLIAAVRALGEPNGGWVPALALTAWASTEDARRALLAGYQKHLAKPVDADALVRAVAELGRRDPRG